ncbi:MAG: HEAT repeat domain-containing protein, partial [Anaerolineaceae bacterium]|nr:HEAT repeat domain-containing protein [Anaerolineaceae bacterium]
LSRIKHPDVLQLMAAALKDPDRHVVQQVIRSMGESKDVRAVALLTPVADDRSDRELSKLAREAIKALHG